MFRIFKKEKINQKEEPCLKNDVLSKEHEISKLITDRNLIYKYRKIKINIKSISNLKEEIIEEKNLNGKFNSSQFFFIGESEGTVTSESSSKLKTFTGSIVYSCPVLSEEYLWNKTQIKKAITEMPFFEKSSIDFEDLKQNLFVEEREHPYANFKYYPVEYTSSGNYYEVPDYLKLKSWSQIYNILKYEIKLYSSLINHDSFKIVERAVDSLSFSLSETGYCYFDILDENRLYLTKELFDKIIYSPIV